MRLRLIIFFSYILMLSTSLHFLTPEAESKAVSFSLDQGNACTSVYLLGLGAIMVVLKLSKNLNHLECC